LDVEIDGQNPAHDQRPRIRDHEFDDFHRAVLAEPPAVPPRFRRDRPAPVEAPGAMLGRLASTCGIA
jgi:hypothetical protein